MNRWASRLMSIRAQAGCAAVLVDGVKDLEKGHVFAQLWGEGTEKVGSE